MNLQISEYTHEGRSNHGHNFTSI